MSKLCDQVIETIRAIFPEMLLVEEKCVTYGNQRLFLDIFLPQLGIVVEVHGRQHDEFVEHFHGDAAGFRASKVRDRLKEEWADIEGLTMVILREDDLPVTPDSLLEKIDESSNSN